jgi:hypothetical protein
MRAAVTLRFNKLRPHPEEHATSCMEKNVTYDLVSGLGTDGRHLRQKNVTYGTNVIYASGRTDWVALTPAACRDRRL